MDVGCIRGDSIFVVTFASLCARFEAVFWAWTGVSSSKLDDVGGTLSSGVCCLVALLIWVCVEEVVEFVGFAIRVAEILVTLVVSWEMFVRSTITGLSVGIACSGDAKVGGSFSSGAVRLVLSHLAWGGDDKAGGTLSSVFVLGSSMCGSAAILVC